MHFFSFWTKGYPQKVFTSADNGMNYLLIFLKDSHIVDNHALRKGGGSIRAARPFSANGYIEYEKELLMKLAQFLRSDVRFMMSCPIIDIPGDIIVIPNN